MRHATISTMILLAAACGAEPETDTAAPADDSLMPTAITTPASATLRDSTGRELGTLVLSEADSGIQVSGRLTGLAQGERGLHIHTVGSCTPTFASAGDHWNPEARQHGTDNAAGPHRGDLLNVQVQSDSVGSVQSVTRGGRLEDLFDADGSTVVLHAGADDYRTDPDGNSGERVACGVVERQ
jgi:Cu-Zn family superoxide dismutase